MNLTRGGQTIRFRTGRKSIDEGHGCSEGLIFSSIPFPLDPSKSKQLVDMRHARNDAIFGRQIPGKRGPLLRAHKHGRAVCAQLTYFGDQWRTHVSRGLAYREDPSGLYGLSRVELGRKIC